MSDPQAAASLVTDLVGDQAGEWDRSGRLPVELLRELGAKGMLCPEVQPEHGGLGFSAEQSGPFIAHVGSLCGSLRSVLTSQGMAAWTIRRYGNREQRAAYLSRLTAGSLAGVAFSEPAAGSDLAAMTTSIRLDGDDVVVDGHKVWVTVGDYADLLVVFGRFADGAAAVVVPTDAEGVRVERVPDPLGCRAAGHANVTLDSVRLPADCLLGGAGQPLGMLVTSALTYGRLSVAWGCVGMLRACLSETARHAKTRSQFGKPLAQHQLVARHLAELLVAEQAATHTCAHASRCWDAANPEMITAAVTAKHFAATQAVRGAAAAVQVLGSAGAGDGHPVARAYRDAKLMEIIEGSSELSQLMLSEHALAVWS